MNDLRLDPLLDPAPIVPTNIRLGVGWRMESQPVGFMDTLLGRETLINLDLACVLLDGQGMLLDQVWCKQVRSQDDAIRYQGDRVAGQASESLEGLQIGDLEIMDLDLDRISDTVHSIWLAVGCSSGHHFNDLSVAHCRMLERQRDGQGTEYLNISLPLHRDASVLLIARLQRDPIQLALWTLHRMETPLSIDTLADLPAAIQAR